MMKILAVHEYNEGGHMYYADNYVGAYVRGANTSVALSKFQSEIIQYLHWLGIYDIDCEKDECEIDIIQEKYSSLAVCDADSDCIFDSERVPLSLNEYEKLKELTLKSAGDYLRLYNSIPNKTDTTLIRRKTFYGDVPVTAEEMYMHTKSVNSYYFWEVGVDASNEPDILTCREQAFSLLEANPCYLDNTVMLGSGNEEWSVRKLCRRFVWHDRIHARAMYKMATALCGKDSVDNVFCFNL